VEVGEPLRAAAAREAREEVDLIVDEASLEDLMDVVDDTPTPVRHVVFVCRQWVGVPRNAEPERAEGLGWYSMATPPHPAAPVIDTALRAAAPPTSQ
jgi:ADP-ribose pyrophosphatase YjhB (NUDIX family)